MKNTSFSRFFTLVELLMVIAIIAILLGIIIPSTQQVRGKSIKSACLSNLRQIGMGLNMYTDENNEFYPYCSQFPGAPVAGEEQMPGIAVTLKPYLKDPKIFLCPADPGEALYRLHGSSYEWHSSVYNGWKASRKTVLESQVPSFPKVPVMYDYERNHGKSDKDGRNFLYPFGNVSGELIK